MICWRLNFVPHIIEFVMLYGHLPSTSYLDRNYVDYSGQVSDLMASVLVLVSFVVYNSELTV